jgi:hypothetical protein
MDSIEAVRQDLNRKGFFTVHRVPDHCPICKKRYLRRVETDLIALICVACNHYEYFLPLKNGKFLTDGVGREIKRGNDVYDHPSDLVNLGVLYFPGKQ